MATRKGTDRFTRDDLPSDGSDKDRDSSDDEDVHTTRPTRGGNAKVHCFFFFSRLVPSSITVCRIVGSSVLTEAGLQKGQQLYCFCKRPYSETEFMICCDGCENWFHGRCVGVTESMASSIDTYYCPKCQARRGEEDDAEPELPAAPKSEPRERATHHADNKSSTLRSPISAPATPLEVAKVSPSTHAQPHSVTPPTSSSRHKRKGLAMRAISKDKPILPPPALPAPEIMAREAAKFKTDIGVPAAQSLLDFTTSTLACCVMGVCVCECETDTALSL